MIHIEHLKKAYGDTSVLEDIDITIADGSIYGLVGYNGAGKTTLLSLMAGILSPDKGKITIDIGADNTPLTVFDHENVRRELFFIPDEPYTLPAATMNTMASFYRGFYPNFSTETFRRLTTVFGLDPKKRISGFSKGMKRQAAIVLGLSARPRYLLLDESFDGLDPSIRLTVCDLLMEYMADTGATVVMASHNLSAIEHICDTVGMLSGNRIVYSTDMDELRTAYTRVRVVLDREIGDPETLLDGIPCGDLHATGKVLTGVVHLPADGTERAVRDALRGRGEVTLFEAYPMSLEDIFTYENHRAGHDGPEEGGDANGINGIFAD